MNNNYDSRPQGPNVKKLIIKLMARTAIPDNGGIADGVEFLLNPAQMVKVGKQCTLDAFKYIDMVKDSYDNPYGDDDEAIAQAIIDKIE